MRMAIAVHALAETGASRNRLTLPFSSTPARGCALQHMGARLPFQHDGVDAVSIEDVRQQHARRAAADDRDLSAHEVILAELF